MRARFVNCPFYRDAVCKGLELMRKIRNVIATTHVDRHNEQLAPAALESMCVQIRSSFLPFIVNHDPRSAPIGRVVDAEIFELPDGEHSLEAEIEIFESGLLPPLTGDRSMPSRELPKDSFLLTIDRSFSRRHFHDAVSAIKREFGDRVAVQGKKALEPIAVLAIGAGSVALGKFANSFFSRLGEKAADLVVEKLKELFQHRETDDDIPLLKFEFGFEHNGSSRCAEVILTGPSGTDIDSFFQEGLSQLDQLLPSCLGELDGIVQYVFSYSKDGLVFKFAVRSDALPLFPRTASPLISRSDPDS